MCILACACELSILLAAELDDSGSKAGSSCELSKDGVFGVLGWINWVPKGVDCLVLLSTLCWLLEGFEEEYHALRSPIGMKFWEIFLYTS